MSVESATEVQDGEAFAAIREAVGPDAEITSIDALTTEITAVIDGTNSLHQQDVVVGEVANYGVSPTDNVHFKLVHRKNSKDDRLHCIISDDQRADITTSIRDGKRVAVTGASRFTRLVVAARSRSTTWSRPTETTTPTSSSGSGRTTASRSRLLPCSCSWYWLSYPSWYCKKHKRTPDTDAIK